MNDRLAAAHFIANTVGIDAQPGATLDAIRQKKDGRLSDFARCAIPRSTEAWIIFSASILIGRAQKLRESTTQKYFLMTIFRAAANSVR
jgi:hypothetical protein